MWLGAFALAGCVDVGNLEHDDTTTTVAQAESGDFGDVLKEGAEWASAVTDYAGAVELVLSLFGDSPEEELHHELQQLYARQRETENLLYTSVNWLASVDLGNDASDVGTEAYASRIDVATYGTVPPTNAAIQLNESLVAIRRIQTNEQYWNHPSYDPATFGEWRSITAYRPPVSGAGLVWDPRWALPALMQAIPMRISTIQAADPAHRLSSVTYASELSSYRDTLIAVKQQLESHMSCGFQVAIDTAWNPVVASATYRLHAICGDPFTGTEVTAVSAPYADTDPFTLTRDPSPLFWPTPGSYTVWTPDNAGAWPIWMSVGTLRSRFWTQTASDIFLHNWMNTTIADLGAQLRGKLGLFQIQREIDTLYTLIHDAPSPISGGRLRSDLTGICLAHIFSLTGGFNVVRTAACDAPLSHTYGQTWTYDPVASQLRSVDAGECLSVLGDAAVPQSFTFVDGCDPASPAQQWSYDPESHRIRNADGYVLDIYNGTTTPGANVWLYWDTGSVAQQWGFPSPWVVAHPPLGPLGR